MPKRTERGRHRWVAAAAAGLLTLAVGAVFPAGGTAGLLDDIKKRGKIVVGTEAAYAPFEFLENGKIVGYDKDVLDRIIAAWGIELEQLDLPFAGILTGLLQKKYDFVCTALLMNPERAEKYAFTMPVAASKVAIVKLRGNAKVKAVDDLTGLVVGSPIPPAGPTAIFGHYHDELKAKRKGAQRHDHFQSDADLFLALRNRQIDAAIESQLVIAELMKKQPGTFEIVGTFGKPFFIGWVTRPEDTDLRDALNQEIRKLRDAGVLAELQKKWFGFTMEIPDRGYLPPGAK